MTWTKIYIIADTAIRIRDNGNMTCAASDFLWNLFGTFLPLTE